MHCSRKVYVTSYATSVTANKTDSPERFQWFATFPCRETWNVRFPSDAKREKEDIIILGRVWHQSESSRQKKNARFIKISHLVYLNSTFYRLVCVVKSVNIRAISRQLIALYINWSARFFFPRGMYYPGSILGTLCVDEKWVDTFTWTLYNLLTSLYFTSCLP